MKLLDRIAKYPRKLTKNEARLVDYILAGYPHHLLASATAIAAKVDISASTVVRFFAKLGYDSLGQVQDEARRELASKLTSPSQRARLATKNKRTLANVVERTITLDKENLSATAQGVDLAAFEQLINALTSTQTRRIYLVGAKNSAAVVQHLFIHLNMCLPNVQVLPMRSELADNLLWATPSDMLLAVTIRRYSRAVLQAAQHFRDIGARVACITDSPLAPVAGLSDHRLLIHTSSLSPFDSYTAAFSLCNAIVAAVAIKRPEEIKRSLRLGEDLWRHFEVFTASDD